MISVNDAPQIFFSISKSVGNGHPDKMCVQISDAILDACVRPDHLSKAAFDTMIGRESGIILGTVTTIASSAVDDVVHGALRDIGCGKSSMNAEYDTCEAMNKLGILRPGGRDVRLSSLDLERRVASNRVCYV